MGFLNIPKNYDIAYFRVVQLNNDIYNILYNSVLSIFLFYIKGWIFSEFLQNIIAKFFK